MATTNILITGTNRGIGKQLLSLYLQRPNHTLVAAVRDPSASVSQELYKLPTAENTKLILVKIDSSDLNDAAKAVSTLQKEHGIISLDVVIANAGVMSEFGNVGEVPIEKLSPVLTINTLAPIALFQAVAPLLRASKQQPAKFVGISSMLGSIAAIENLIPFKCGHYNVSKTALNSLLLALHFENPDLIIFPVHPGHVETDMGHGAAVQIGLEAAPVTVEDSAAQLLAITDAATREKTSGVFKSIGQDEALPW